MTPDRSATGVVLDVQNLSKAYREVQAVRDVSLWVERGEVVCLLGPNGSGKTTLIECVEGLRTPDQGSIEVLGAPMRAGGRRPREVGVQLQEEGLPARITVAEAIKLYAAIYEVDQVPDGLLDRLGLLDLMKRRFEKLSGGQKRRTALALAFINSPQLAILDEPTSGLDPQGQRVVVDLLRDRSAQGTGILTTLHDMRVAAEIADRVVVLRSGVMLASGRPAELIEALPYDSCLALPDNVAVAAVRDMDYSLVARPNGEGGYNVYGSRTELTRVWEQLGPRTGASNLRSCDLSDLAILVDEPVGDRS